MLRAGPSNDFVDKVVKKPKKFDLDMPKATTNPVGMARDSISAGTGAARKGVDIGMKSAKFGAKAGIGAAKKGINIGKKSIGFGKKLLKKSLFGF
jgi:hypothetical protein